MALSTYTDKKIQRILKEAESGKTVAHLCQKHGMSASSFYSWRSRFGENQNSVTERMKQLDAENKRLRKLCTALQRDAHMLMRALA